MTLAEILTAPLLGVANRIRAPARGPVDAVLQSTGGIVYGTSAGTPERAQKLSAVYAAVDIRANSMSVLPAYVMDTGTRERPDHPILRLLSERPNEAMAPAVRKYMLERDILLQGNAYDWIIRDPRTMEPMELIPIPAGLVQGWKDERGHPWYDVAHPVTGAIMRLPGEDICHYKGPTRDGWKGLSVLSYAAETIAGGLAAQSYNTSYYERGGQPAGVLTVDADLGGYVKDKDGQITDQTLKDKLRREWERIHSGPSNAHRIAILDHGLKYQSLAISQKDSQFVESQAVVVEDIARFFGVPLYKLQAGKQSYNSNEQNAIEYLNNLQPRVTQMEEEQTYKLLRLSDRARGLEVRYNMAALLRSDNQSRSAYYRAMREMSVYSVNDVRALEDLPDVEGGDDRQARIDMVPLRDWARLSEAKYGGGGETSET